MRVEIRKTPYDIYGVLAVSTILVMIIALNEWTGLELQVLRVLTGLPFILFFPGYLLISALYPEKKRFFGPDGEPVLPADIMDEEGGEERGIKGKGLDGLERFALSLGISIAITPLIGLVLNWTYEWDPDHLGIRLVPILVSQYGFILITGIIALRRRMSVPLEDRFSISLDLSFPSDYTRTDKLLTIGIVLMMVLSIGMVVYLIVAPRDGESFTELYVLGPGRMADDYPRNLLLEEEALVYVGIGNHEHRDINYTLVMSIDNEARNTTASSFDHVTLSRSQQPSKHLMVKEGETVEFPVSFSVLEVGTYKLRFILFLDGVEYRDIHLWIKVFGEGALERSDDGSLELYIAGPDGDPSRSHIENQTAPFSIYSIGLRNNGIVDLDLNLTIGTGSQDTWSIIEGSADLVTISSETGSYLELRLNASSSLEIKDLRLDVDEVNNDLKFRVRGDGFDMSITRSVEDM